MNTEPYISNPQDNIKIIGICLIKNEDLFIERVLKNVLDFCDEVIVLDNMSADNTFDIVNKLASNYSKITAHRLGDALKSHQFIEKFANTKTWVFGVDGDEIYDPTGLKRLRREILSGDYQSKWRITGNCLHCFEINAKTACGYLAPPSRQATKLFNFNALVSWNETSSERLHGTNLIFKEGFDRSLVYKISDKHDWANSYFKCLHLCFVKRSSLDTGKKNLLRLNPTQQSHKTALAMNFIRNLLDGKIGFDSNYKLKMYKVGDVVTESIHPFSKQLLNQEKIGRAHV